MSLCETVSHYRVWACRGDQHGFVRLFVARLNLFDELKSAHTHDDTAEDDVLVVEKGQGSTHSYVKLRLIGVAQAVSLAHAKHADLSMLHGEGLVFKFRAVDGGAKLRVLCVGNFAHLDVHSFNDAVDFGASVCGNRLVTSSVSLAQTQEVGDSTWGQVIE